MKKVKIICASILAVLTAVVTVNQSFGWFGYKDNIDSEEKLGGNFTTSYFHRGKGTKGEPFEITKPFHYENMIKLHYEQTSFATTTYFFRFGSTDDRMPGKPKSPVFYYTDEDGNVDPSKTSTTLYLGGKEFPPLGTAEYPFIGQLDGSSLTISNFKIAGKGYYDVGIFGYVNTNTNEDGSSPIHDAYWKNFTIDTTETSNLVHKHDIPESHPERAHYSNDTSVQLGYLAGHTVYSAAFSNCYVDDCKFKSNNNGAASNTSYGYFGKAENDYLGGSTGRGKTYSYKLDSEVIYRSTRQIYDSVGNNPIRTRDGYTEYTTPINNELPEIDEITGGTKTKYPLNSAITRTKARDNNDTYVIQGNTPSSGSAARNYSFSTIGYQPTTTQVAPKEYEAFYTSDGSRKYMPKDTIPKNDWKDKKIDATTKDSTSTLGDTGDFYYYNGNNWNYIHSENSTSIKTDAVSFKIKTSAFGNHTFKDFAGLGSNISVQYAQGFLYIDNNLVYFENLNDDEGNRITAETSSAGTKIKIQNVNFTNNEFSVNLKRGIHYFEYYFVVKTYTSAWGGNYELFWFNNSKNNVTGSNNGQITANAGTFTIEQDLYDSPEADRIVKLDCTTYSPHVDKTDSNFTVNITNNCSTPTAKDIPPYVSSKTFQVSLYGVQRQVDPSASEIVIELTAASLNWKKEEDTDWYKWVAYNTPTIEVDYSKDPYYLSSNPDITPRISEEGYIEGYEWKNIDIVGGGVSFYYRNLDFAGDIRIISIPAESNTKYICNALSDDDITNHRRFYATKYCPCSIVLYFNNVGNAADTNDTELGNLDFSYVNVSFLGASLINLSVPAFKKGYKKDATQFVTLGDIGKVTGEDVLDLYSTFTATIKESQAKMASFCALDSDRNILGEFNADGTPGRGFINIDGSLDKKQLAKIDTYVLALGSYSDDIVDSSWIKEINFKYKSNEGYGGTFGSIEYRTSPATVTSTICNFFINIPANANYILSIEYKEDSDEGYSGKNYFIYLYSSNGDDLSMNVYLYDSSYVFTFNGTEHSEKTAIGLKSTSTEPPD